MTEVPRIIDIYQGDNVDSFQTAYDAGLRAVIHKATTGATGRDARYAERRGPALAAGLLWGAYHWGTKANVAAQIENFLKRAQPDEHTLVALDFEKTPGNQMSIQQAHQFLQGIEQKLGRKAVVYCGGYLKDTLHHQKDAVLGAHRLWLAQYGNHAVPQDSWESYWLWQYTDGKSGPDPKKCPGVPGNSKGELDCDRYEGTLAQLRTEWAT